MARTMTTAGATAAAATAAALIASAVPAQAQVAQIYNGEHGPVEIAVVAEGLEHPWAVAFLPDGRMLVTERPGRLRIVGTDGSLSPPLAGLPEIYAEDQGGLLDVHLHPDFAENSLVYLTFSEPGGEGASTAVLRGRLTDDALEATEIVFSQQPKVSGGKHFGSRLAFAPDGTLFVGLGERFKFDPAQDLRSHLGAVVRVNDDGSVPDDNPFVGRDDAQAEIWSYGHRNIQGAAIHPETGELWVHEHGPLGGDELNIPEAGKNYGWPEVSWGIHYDNREIPDPPTRPEFERAIHYWTPVLAASGMAFYTADAFPQWQGNLLVGGLVTQNVVRVELNGREVVHEEGIPIGSRVRDVRVGPDGAVYVLTDEAEGRLLRLSPPAG